jgi:hypothetical protein
MTGTESEDGHTVLILWMQMRPAVSTPYGRCSGLPSAVERRWVEVGDLPDRETDSTFDFRRAHPSM